MPHYMSNETIPVRYGEELNLIILERFLRGNIENLPNSPLEILQFSAGHSNLTYQLRVGAWEAVLRRPPLGPVAPKAHDMEREFKILSALNPIFSVAPKPLLFSDLLEVVGSPFFIMERKNGIVLDTFFPEGMNGSTERCQQLSEIMVEKLVELHSINYEQTALEKMSKPDGFMERQVLGWTQRYDRSKTDDIDSVEFLKKWLADNTPKQHEATIIHYDYKFNNAMFNESLTDMVGLFDWEMTTVGDPLVDLGAAMSYWIQEDDPDLLKKGFGKPSITVHKGFLTRKQFIELYAKKSGRDVSNMNFYLTFAYFKLAVICQQIYYRYKKGQTRDSRFAHFNHFVKSLIQHATNVACE